MARKSRYRVDAAPGLQSAVTPSRQYSVGAYVRLSAVDKKHKGDSIETQQAIISAFIDDRQDMYLVETYIDNGISGQTFERPAFQRMIADVESGRIDCCVTKDLSRLGRNAIDTGYYIEKYFPAQGVRFVAVTDSYDSSDSHSSTIMVSLKNMVNEAYAVDIGRKIRATKQMNIRSGCFVGRIPPYGFLKDPEDNHRLIPDEATAPIVLRMFEMAAEGMTASTIMGWLNTSGVPTPRRYFHSLGLITEKEAGEHIHWNKGVVYHMLGNRVYCGDMVQGKNQNTRHVQKRIPASEWVITENTHEAIVSRELFHAVQERDKQWSPPKTQPEQKSENIFLRKIFCGHCGYAMSRNRSGKTRYRFGYNTRSMYGQFDCVPVNICETTLKEKLVAMLREQDFSLPVPANESGGDAELRSVRAEIERNDRFLSGLYESMVRGDLSSGEFREMKATYEAKITALKEREISLRSDSFTRARQAAESSQAAVRVRGLSDISALTVETVDSLIEKIRVFTDGSIEVKFCFSDTPVRSGEVMGDE